MIAALDEGESDIIAAYRVIYLDGVSGRHIRVGITLQDAHWTITVQSGLQHQMQAAIADEAGCKRIWIAISRRPHTYTLF